VREVVVAEPTPGTLELQLRVRDPLGSPIALSAVPPSRGWDLPLGVDERGRPVAGSCRNLSGVVVGGVPGGGKSNWLTVALASLAQYENIQWLLIDGKQGYDLEGLALRAYRYISGDDAGDLEIVRDALQDVQVLMRARLGHARELYGHANLWSAGPTRLHPAVIVVIDECQTYLDARSLPSKESKAIGAEIDAIVRDLVKRGRSAGIMLVLSTQRPTADSIPTSTRDNCALRVCFSVRTREAATAVLGEFTAESSVSPIGAPTGVGVSSVEGVEVRFRSPFVEDKAIREHTRAAAELTADPLDLLSRAFLELAGRTEVESLASAGEPEPHYSDTSRPGPAREPMDR
jgi:DNA segregation ATPase FtsK/SpoIIIE-like protein